MASWFVVHLDAGYTIPDYRDAKVTVAEEMLSVTVATGNSVIVVGVSDPHGVYVDEGVAAVATELPGNQHPVIVVEEPDQHGISVEEGKATAAVEIPGNLLVKEF